MPETFDVEAVINGIAHRLTVAEDTTLDQVTADALAVGNTTGRPARDWEVRDTAGVLLNEYGARRLIDLNLPARLNGDIRIYLNLAAGWGG